MPNIGIAPVSSGSTVGATRSLIGDTDYIPLVPPIEGFGDYARFSDNDILGFLAAGRGSTLRATGFALLQLSTTLALESAAITSADMRVDVTKRSTDARLAAESWFLRANAEDAAAESANSYFDIIVPTSAGHPMPPRNPVAVPGLPGFYFA